VNKEIVWPYLKRFLIILLVCSVLAGVGSEIAFRVQRNNIDRGPQDIELIIPAGTAAKVAKGQAVPSLPEEMVFIIGDVLIVQNEDSETHELGPLLIPPGTSASMPMKEVDNLALGCSFQPSNYLGMEIKEATTWETRLLAISFVAPPTAIIAFLYSLAIRGIDPNEELAEEKKK
jgi:hypothetical protein